MIKADITDKERIIDILSNSFDDNKSVNYIIKQGKKRKDRIRKLISYSFEMCYLFGHVFISEDNNGCALLLMPDKKKTTLKSVLLDIKLALSAIGLSNIMKAMKRETEINKLHTDKRIYYLWFIAVDTSEQGKGIGTMLMNEIIQESASLNRTICLETSMLKNLPWYEKFGFKIYRELDFGYKLYCMKRG